MAGKLNNLFGLLLVLVMMSVGSWGESGEKLTCTELATKAMVTCNSQIKHVYYVGTQVRGFDVTKVFCYGMMKLRGCAETMTERFYDIEKCSSNDDKNLLMMEKWFFVVMQYLLMSRRVGTCDWDITRLKNYYKKLGFEGKYGSESVFSIVPTTEEKAIAKKIHENCIPELMVDPVAYELEQDLCKGVTNFIECYKRGVAEEIEEAGQAPLISTRFATLIDNFSTKLISEYKMDPEKMCFVQLSALND